MHHQPAIRRYCQPPDNNYDHLCAAEQEANARGFSGIRPSLCTEILPVQEETKDGDRNLVKQSWLCLQRTSGPGHDASIYNQQRKQCDTSVMSCLSVVHQLLPVFCSESSIAHFLPDYCQGIFSSIRVLVKKQGVSRLIGFNSEMWHFFSSNCCTSSCSVSHLKQTNTL